MLVVLIGFFKVLNAPGLIMRLTFDFFLILDCFLSLPCFYQSKLLYVVNMFLFLAYLINIWIVLFPDKTLMFLKLFLPCFLSFI